MRNTLEITAIKFRDNGTKIEYQYTYDKAISKYFNTKELFFVSYNLDVSKTPNSIAIIPLLANLMPIAWFGGFDVCVEELDETFFGSLEKIKIEFQKLFVELKGVESNLKVKSIINNTNYETNAAMLFSGGVDAYATYFRHRKENLDLITIHGADIEINDMKQWDSVVSLNENERLLTNNKNHYIKSNLRTFYTYKVEFLLKERGWWGKVQHGLALNCLLAPLSTIYNYSKIYIASSYTDNIKISWGSTPEIDNLIKWSSVFVIHDGYELKRQEKVNLIIDSAKKLDEKIKLRVCYSELNKEVNCSKCEKCFRTIFGIILSNDNPNKYGFNVDESVYDSTLNMLENGFKTEGVQYFWWEINEAISNSTDFYNFSNKEYEKNKMIALQKLLNLNFEIGVKKPSNLNKLKYKLINTFPKVFKIYLHYKHKNL